MKKNLLVLITLFTISSYFVCAQNYLEVSIIQTDEAISDSIWVEDPATEEDTLFAVVTVPLSSDDAEEIWEHILEAGSESEIDDLNDDDLDMGWEGEAEDLNIVSVGLRFQDITIPQGAIIDSAYIQVVSHEEKLEEDVAKITITAEASDDAQTFTEDALITARPKTSASVYWIVDTYWDLWSIERTPDLAELVQEVVNRSGWQSGNSIAFIMEGENQGVSDLENAREFESFENIQDPEEGGDGQNHPENVPVFKVYWSDATAINHTLDESVKLYPNPSENGILNISIAANSGTLEIYNITGGLVKTILLNSNNTSLDLSELNHGVYMVKVVQNNESSVKRLILK